jgi:hypothetical protein
MGINGSSFSSDSPYTGEALLTFNANKTNAGQPETGRLTGIDPPPSPYRTAAAGVQEIEFSGPYVIDARDVLGREWDGLPDFPGPFFQGAEK